MKFIYCMQKHLAEDFVAMGLRKIGTCKINGEEVSVFANDPNIMLNKYQKSAVALTNMLYFDTIIDNPKKEDVVEAQVEEVNSELKED